MISESAFDNWSQFETWFSQIENDIADRICLKQLKTDMPPTYFQFLKLSTQYSKVFLAKLSGFCVISDIIGVGVSYYNIIGVSSHFAT